MARILLGLGSNIGREHHLKIGVQALQQLEPNLLLSPVYQSEAVGFDGDDFFNLVACLQVNIELSALVTYLTEVEHKYGRVKGELRFSAKTLDIDILTFDDRNGVFDGITLPREEILQNAFVLKPLADVCGDDIHPQQGKTYAELWRDMADQMQPVTQCELQLI